MHEILFVQICFISHSARPAAASAARQCEQQQNDHHRVPGVLSPADRSDIIAFRAVQPPELTREHSHQVKLKNMLCGSFLIYIFNKLNS